MANKPTEPYFAPAVQSGGLTNAQAGGLDRSSAEASFLDGRPAWGEDAAEIAREAGLGSYGAEVATQEQREEALLRTLDGVTGTVAGLRALVLVLCGAVLGLAAAVAWLWLRTVAAP